MSRKALELKYTTRSTTALAGAISALEEIYGTPQGVKDEIGNLIVDVMAPYTAAFKGASQAEVEQLIHKSEMRLKTRLFGALQFITSNQSTEESTLTAEQTSMPSPVAATFDDADMGDFADITSEPDY